MYYIINEARHIIAADQNLLELCGFSEINELTSNIILEKISLKTLPNNQIIITTASESHTFPITYTSLSSLVGELTLINLDTSNPLTQASIEDAIDIDSLIIKSSTPDDHMIINNIEMEKDTTFSEKDLPRDTPSSISMDTPKDENINDFLTLKEEQDLEAPLDLLSPNIDNTPTITSETKQLSPTVNIIVDIAKVSKHIGISEKDFILFLNEYIDTALDLEKDLQSNDKEICSSAINTLVHLSEVLHLDEVNKILQDIDNSNDDTHMFHVTSFYDALSRITTEKDSIGIHLEEQEEEIEDVVLLDLLKDQDTENLNTTLDTQHESPVSTDIAIEPEILIKSIEEPTIPTPLENKDIIDLSSINPIHFDFQISVASDELSLPQSLIEEFMIDFIKQAHIETDKMLEAYQAGDLDSIQKIGHLLKGVSSNLRITTLSDTLYKIQFSEKIDEIPDLIKTYWGHFLFFEKQIKRLPN